MENEIIKIYNDEDLVKEITGMYYKEYREKFPMDVIDVQVLQDEDGDTYVQYGSEADTNWNVAGWKHEDEEWFEKVMTGLQKHRRG